MRVLQQQPESGEKGGKEESEMESWGLGGAEREKGYDWLEEDRRGKKERGTERIEAGREKWEGDEGVTANGVGLAEERWEYRERESRQKAGVWQLHYWERAS